MLAIVYVMPGFVDAHTHPVFAGNRADEFEKRSEGSTYQEIAAAGGGIRSTVRRTRAASEDDLLQATSHYVQWFLRNGTTTIEAKSGYGLSLEDELKLLRVIARITAGANRADVPGRARDSGRVSGSAQRIRRFCRLMKCC